MLPYTSPGKGAPLDSRGRSRDSTGTTNNLYRQRQPYHQPVAQGQPPVAQGQQQPQVHAPRPQGAYHKEAFPIHKRPSSEANIKSFHPPSTARNSGSDVTDHRGRTQPYGAPGALPHKEPIVNLQERRQQLHQQPPPPPPPPPSKAMLAVVDSDEEDDDEGFFDVISPTTATPTRATPASHAPPGFPTNTQPQMQRVPLVAGSDTSSEAAQIAPTSHRQPSTPTGARFSRAHSFTSGSQSNRRQPLPPSPVRGLSPRIVSLSPRQKRGMCFFLKVSQFYFLHFL